ncbi:hypothetical protein L1987_77656 [Smallanthus sonchifolius]|uniref:Uncharacterized protein n=1 Tax=Smallanthus sonchifolius TaxID=185202 RepID=A0ACB8Z9N1_9ASTR|nr:hypothetical protein L1987_77656 [Smallanthus sonchifolius]
MGDVLAPSFEHHLSLLMSYSAPKDAYSPSAFLQKKFGNLFMMSQARKETSKRDKELQGKHMGLYDDELFVCPWMAVVANIPVELKNDQYVGESGKKLKDEWIKEGYNLVKVYPLWKREGHSGLAVVEFGKTWVGFGHVMRKKMKNNSKLIMGLKTMIDEKSRRSEEMKSEISKTDLHMADIIKQKEEMVENHTRDMEIIQEKANMQLKRFTDEHEQLKLLLEDREKELRDREAFNETKKRKLERKKRMVLEMNWQFRGKKKAHERFLDLAEEQKEIIDEEDEKIVRLKREVDSDVFNTVVTALNEFNPRWPSFGTTRRR